MKKTFICNILESILNLIYIIILCFIGTFLPSYFFLVAVIFGIGLISFINVNFSVFGQSESGNSIFLPMVIILFQNVYLGLMANNLTPFNTQCCLMMSYLYCVFYSVFYLNKNIKNITNIQKQTFNYIVILIFYSIILIFIFGTVFNSYIAGIRNLSGPFIYLIYGMCFKKEKQFNAFVDMLLFYGLIVLLVGYYEIFFNPNMWLDLNVGTLFANKGIEIATWGLPANFVSSEIIFGSQHRRMSSTFADPVNLGTFLFAYAMVCKLKKKNVLLCLTIIAMVLTISKGALLSILIFALVYSFYKKKKVLLHIFTPGIVIVFCLAFIIYSSNKSTGSLFAHFSGFTNGIESLIMNPIGVGVGNIGVISILNGASLNSSIAESGFGTLVGSCGFIGLTLYLLFNYEMLHRSVRLKSINLKIFSVSLILSILVNIMFNEVAFSPNSCFIYFALIGYCLLSETKKTIAVTSNQKVKLVNVNSYMRL